MITIPAAVARIVRERPLLEEGLVQGIINLSALARQIRAQVEKEARKPAGEAAIVMALKRLTPRLSGKPPALRRLIRDLSDIAVRSAISEFTYHTSPAIVECQRRLLQAASSVPQRFLTFTQGAAETAVIVSTELEAKVASIFRREHLVSHLDGLAAMSIRLSPKSVAMPGVYYTLLKQLLWEDVNVIEVVSTFTEFTLILEQRNVDRAFSALTRYLWSERVPAAGHRAPAHRGRPLP